MLVETESAREMAANAIRFFEFNTSANVPSVGLGTWQAAPDVLACTVTTAIKDGCRHIDCASSYQNQAAIGLAIKKLFYEGVVKCEELWIMLRCSDHAQEGVPVGLDKTLKELQLESLIFIWASKIPLAGLHEEGFSWVRSKPDFPNTWKAMESLYDSGKARAIGVSNFSIRKLGDLLEVA